MIINLILTTFNINYIDIDKIFSHSQQSCFNKNSTEAKMVSAAVKSQVKHSWYLTDELCVFGLFDDDVSTEEKADMAQVIIIYLCLNTQRITWVNTGL